jgi:hypothetical protein
MKLAKDHVEWWDLGSAITHTCFYSVTREQSSTYSVSFISKGKSTKQCNHLYKFDFADT